MVVDRQQLESETDKRCSPSGSCQKRRRTAHRQAEDGSKFPLGQVVATSTVLDTLPAQDVAAALDRHRRGDWGDVDKEDWQANERALKQSERLLSMYHAAEGTKFWIITEWDRSLTTVLLPEDY